MKLKEKLSYVKVLETEMAEECGDLTHYFYNIEECWESGRFDFIEEYELRLYNRLKKCYDLEKFMNIVEDRFYFFEVDYFYEIVEKQ